MGGMKTNEYWIWFIAINNNISNICVYVYGVRPLTGCQIHSEQIIQNQGHYCYVFSFSINDNGKIKLNLNLTEKKIEKFNFNQKHNIKAATFYFNYIFIYVNFVEI